MFSWMLRSFDYVFYRTTNFYVSEEKDSSPRISGVLHVTLLQSCTFLAVVLVLSMSLFRESRPLGNNAKRSGATISMVILALNMYRYFKVVTYEQLDSRWGKESMLTRRRRARWFVCYWIVLITVIGIFGYINYLKKHP